MYPPVMGATTPPRFPIMFIEPASVPVNFPPTSMHAPQAPGMMKSFEKLAMPMASMPHNGSCNAVASHKPLAEYTKADLKREFLPAKDCSPNCTIGCVHRISYIDHWRAPQTSTISPGIAGDGAEEPELVQIHTGN